MTESPSLIFRDSLKEVFTLLAIHAVITGTGPGRRHKVEVLNKSAILFACAAFEAFIEDLAGRAFDHIVAHAKDHTSLPKVVLQTIAISLKDDKHDLRIWELAGDGWKKVAESYKHDLIRRYIGPFNTPKPQNIQELLKKLLGINDITFFWSWRGMTKRSANDKLKAFVELRGALAHGKNSASPVQKKDVISHLDFLAPLNVRTSNTVRTHCHSVTGVYPWPDVRFGHVS
jgi:hypothetical protein